MIEGPAQAMTAQFYLQAVFKEHGILIAFCTKQSGIMDVPERWEVIRRAIEFYGYADKSIALPNRPSKETYGSAFERATGQPVTKPGEEIARKSA